MEIKSNLDILLISIPRLELRDPLCGPALFKAIIEDLTSKFAENSRLMAW